MSELTIMYDLKKLTNIIYTIKFPLSETYNIRTQIRRAIISTRLNIREGNVFTGKNKIRFFKISLGSLHEVDECMIISKELNYISLVDYDSYKEQYWLCLNKLKKLINSINSK